jgi:bacterioferritin-associated ferredoxin
MYVCICRGIREADVREEGARGIVAPDALIRELGLDSAGCCGQCIENIQDFVELAWEGAQSAHHPPPVNPRPALALRANQTR